MNWNFSYKPDSYFEDLKLEQKLGSKIKGQIRGNIVSSNIRDGEVPPELLKSELGESLKFAQGQIHPWMMGGEYLPDLKMSQVEICRIVLKSTTMDVFSIRAQKIEQKLHYSVADEYGDNEYHLPQVSSLEPLTMGELIKNLDSCIEVLTHTGEESEYGGGGLVRPWLFQQFEYGDSAEEASNFVTVHSVFYPDIGEYYEYQKLVWFQEMKEGVNI
jgi:hypothetical protein